ncbi:hypothetical protein H0H92_003149 [Tricholoma furcatifolium]|nr:hypothetical protein H0H92_003149 [Tricholoma furcatifolium]
MDATSVLSDDDYDLVSNCGLESSLTGTDYGHIPVPNVHEPPPSQIARDQFDSVSWTAAEIQAYVSKSLALTAPPLPSMNEKTRRVYVDGVFDGLNAGHALRLRQAKLSFPSVYLIVGVYSDDQLKMHGYVTSFPHVERCEAMRHCRWVDEVIADAPYVLDAEFIDRHRLDYVSIEEGTSVDPTCDKTRLKGYDAMKDLKIVIPTRKTCGLSAVCLALPMATKEAALPENIQIDVYGIGY